MEFYFVFFYYSSWNPSKDETNRVLTHHRSKEVHRETRREILIPTKSQKRQCLPLLEPSRNAHIAQATRVPTATVFSRHHIVWKTDEPFFKSADKERFACRQLSYWNIEIKKKNKTSFRKQYEWWKLKRTFVRFLPHKNIASHTKFITQNHTNI
jgi:hypothetical protein